MGALYYCADSDVTNRLSDSLTDSPLDTAAKRAVELLGPARDWIDSIYTGISPFPNYTAAAEEWSVNQSDHEAGDTTVIIDGGSTAPVVGAQFRVEDQNTWYEVTAHSSSTVTYASDPPDWTGQAKAEFPDNSRLYFGAPGLIRSAAIWYAVALGTQILRRQPNDEAVQAAFDQARSIVGLTENGQALRPPWPYYSKANDVSSSPVSFTPALPPLSR